jgi:hypothetical protein
MPATAPVRAAIDDTVSPPEIMWSRATRAPSRTPGACVSIATTCTTSGPALVVKR